MLIQYNIYIYKKQINLIHSEFYTKRLGLKHTHTQNRKQKKK